MSDVQILPSNEANQEERQEKLSGDYTRPFSPPDDVKSTVNSDNQALDSADAPAQQAYDENISSAAEVNDPGDRGVKGYRPEGYAPPQNGPVKVRKRRVQDNENN